MKKEIKAVIFDFDGTLVNSTEILLEELLTSANKLGGKVTPEDFMRLNGLSLKAGIKELIREKKLTRWALFRMLFRTGKVKRALREQVALYPQAMSCLESLAGNYKLGIATTGSRKHVEHFTNNLCIRHFFEVIVSKDDVQRKKPDPEPYLLAASQLGVEPSHCMAVEDSPYGLLSAVRAGMSTCVVVRTSSREYFTGESVPDHFIDDLSGLLPLISFF